MRFTIPSTGCEIELESISKDKKPVYTFRYLNRDKKPFTVYLENIERNLKFEVWKKI